MRRQCVPYLFAYGLGIQRELQQPAIGHLLGQKGKINVRSKLDILATEIIDLVRLPQVCATTHAEWQKNPQKAVQLFVFSSFFTTYKG